MGTLEQLRSAGGIIAVSPHDPWESWPRAHYGSWPMVVKLLDRVEVEWFRQVLPTTPQEGDDEIAVSNVAIIAAARFIPLENGEPFIARSMYAHWFRPHPAVGSPYIYSDTAAHHIMSDLSAFIGDTNPGEPPYSGDRGHEQRLRDHRRQPTGLVPAGGWRFRPHGRVGSGVHGTTASRCSLVEPGEPTGTIASVYG